MMPYRLSRNPRISIPPSSRFADAPSQGRLDRCLCRRSLHADRPLERTDRRRAWRRDRRATARAGAMAGHGDPDYRFSPSGEVTVDMHAQDCFHSRNPGPFTTENPSAVVYAPTRRPNPSSNQLELRATASWPTFDVAVFVNNVLNAQPTLQCRNYVPSDTLFHATTLRPRTVGLTVNWRF